ncbi:MAG: hypothetical protein J0I10_17415 [Verrucomicrobia bacterium]|nr:hypothetical protein [Verrucomicrobiota bacterium]
MSSNEYRLVTEYELVDYPCGLSAGDRLRVKVAIVVHQGSKPTGVVHPVGDVWTVLRGVVDEPDIVWLRQPDGKSHTWTGSDIFETFEKVTNPQEEPPSHAPRP